MDKSGDIWIRTVLQGMMRYDVKANKVSTVEMPMQHDKELNALYYDRLTNSLWMAESFNGVYVYNITTKETRHYGLNKTNTQRMAAVISITGDGNGNIWMSDLDEGIIGYDHGTGKFNRISVFDGLFSDNCGFLLMDAKKMLWMNADVGVCRFDPTSKTIVNYSDGEGLPKTPESYLSIDRYGNMYLPYKDGYYTWDRDGLNIPAKTGSIYLRDVVLFDNPIPKDTVFHFLYKENNIRLLFGLLSFDDRETLNLEYSLNGGGLIAQNMHSYISFASLAAGNYDLLVRIKNETIPNMHIHFTVAGPFWLKSWFIVLSVLVVIIVMFLIVKRRLKIVRKEALLKQQAAESEMSALRSQMNPHFIFNTLNSINSYIIENKRDEASDYLTDFSRLVRIILEHSQKKKVTLHEELNALKLYLELESKRLEASFDYAIKINPDVDTGSVSIPPLIIQPFVENAIWHGLREKKRVGHIGINIKKLNGGIGITVEDNGIGRVASGRNQRVTPSNSFGTHATMQRIRLNDSKSSVRIEDLYNNGAAAGTKVIIFLNLNS